MNLYITKLNGMGSSMRMVQCMTAEIAHQLGFREMGIYHYNANAESVEDRFVRFDGIIAGISAGDIVVCQLHTWNGLKFERGLIDRIKAYHGRVVIFIHSVEALMIRSSGFMLEETVKMYNQAEALIVPSYAMKQFLLESGIRAGMKFVVQEMWDCPTSMHFRKEPELRREIHCAGGYERKVIDNWNHDVLLKIYSAESFQGRNVHSMGFRNTDELILEFSQGGFGLDWYHDEQAHRYMRYGNSLSLSPYLVAGIPVIIPVGCSCQKLIEENHLGLVVESMDEAADMIENMSGSIYTEYVQHVRRFAPALRSGCYTKKCLVDSVQALCREDIGKEIVQTEDIYSVDDFVFNSVSLRESYGENLALSWSMEGKPDGFLVYDSSGRLIEDTDNIYQHYLLLRGYGKKESFVVKAYVNSYKGKLIVAQSGTIRLEEQSSQEPLVSVVIPAYNAETYIARCMDTALAQTFANLEIVVIDDGSTDHTSEILGWYAEKYPNIRVIRQQNAGVQAARNKGIECAKGEYISFVDSDDMIRLDMIEQLYRSAEANHCDIAVTSSWKIESKGYSAMMQYSIQENTAISAEEFLGMYASEAYALPAVWNKLYRASLVKEHLLPAIRYEDEAWTPCILSYAEKVCYLNGCLYEYDRSTYYGSLVESWAAKPKEEVFQDHKRSILFYLEQGNPKRRSLLKYLADNELAYFARVLSYPAYEEARKQIAEIRW